MQARRFLNYTKIKFHKPFNTYWGSYILRCKIKNPHEFIQFKD
jgi:hypothetical protein